MSFSPTTVTLRKLKPFAAAAALAAACAISTAVAAPESAMAAAPNSREELPADRADVSRFADEIAARDKLDASWVHAMFDQAIFLPEIRPLMVPRTAPGAKNWRAYRKRFVNAARIQAGVHFWLRNREALRRAEDEFGVPSAIIIGILGVETIYGRNTGNLRVLDALVTLAFDFPSEHPHAADRQAFFRNELEQFLILCAHTGMDPLAATGSYAGAMGIPQFMPSSWQRYAVDFDGDGKIDLWGSDADAIGSVANYFKAHGWRAGEPTHYSVRLAPDADLERLLAPDIQPTFSPAEFRQLGATVSGHDGADSDPLALIELPNGDPALPGHKPTYVAGTENFYVVTRYNHSALYAMAAIDLGEQIARVVAPKTASAGS